jgi:hypothetical protein
LEEAVRSNLGDEEHLHNAEAEFMNRTISLRFLGIILKVLRLEIAV